MQKCFRLGAAFGVVALLCLVEGRPGNAAPDDKAPASQAETEKGRVIKLDAKPDAITFDTRKAVVIVVDMENDFGSKGGMFDRAGIDISGIQNAVGPTAKVLAAAREAGMKIVYLKMGYKPDLSDLGAPESVNRVRHLRLHVGVSREAGPLWDQRE